MALNKQTIDVPLTGGLDTKTSRKNVAPPNFIELRNVQRREAGKLEKRFGHENLGLTAASSADIATAASLAPRTLDSRRDELVLASNVRLLTRSTADAKWYQKGYIVPCSTRLTPVVPSPVSASEIDVLVKDGVRVTTWVEASTLYYNITDDTTGAQLVTRTSISGSKARITAISGYIVIWYHNSGDIKYIRIPTAAPTTTSTGTAYSTLDASRAFDAVGMGDYFYLFFHTSTAATMRVSKFDSSLTVIATNTMAGTPVSYLRMAIAAAADSSSLWLGWSETASNNLKGASYTPALVVNGGGPTIIEAVANQDKLTIAALTATSAYYYYSITASNVYDYSVRANTFDGTTAGTANVLMRSVGLASRAYYDSTQLGVVMNVLHESTLQATYFTVLGSPIVTAKYAAGQGGTHSAVGRLSNFLPRSSAPDSYTFAWGMLKKGRVQSENATLFGTLSPYMADLIADTKRIGPAVQMQGSLLYPGGILKSYDGVSPTEHGWHMGPENLAYTQSATGPGVLSTTGQYLVAAVYEWTDAQGIRHQSAPSIPYRVEMSGSNDTITVTVPTPRLTDKHINYFPVRADTIVKVYVSEDDGTVLYYNAQATVPNIYTTDSVDVTINSVSGVTSNEILYTSGGALENIGAPSSRFGFIHDNRLVLVGLENPHQVDLGKDIKGEDGPGFNEDLVLTLDATGGEIVGGASLGGAMVIFKKTATYVIAGAGPNDTGAGSTLGAPQLISTNIGCRDPKSIVQLPEGIAFMSHRGIYVLTQGLQLQYFGAPVEDYNANIIVGATYCTTTSELRFATNADVTLVYNTEFQTWAVFDTPGSIALTLWQNTPVYLTPTKVMREDQSSYLDDGSYVQSRIRTGWIHLAGMQGFQRVYRMALLGTYHTNHSFTVRHYFDYSETPQNDTTVTASTLVNTGVWGDSATWGSDSFWGGSDVDEVYQMREHMPRQRCQSVSFELFDSIVGSTDGHGFSLESVSLLIGTKTGLNRTSATRSV